VAELLGHGLAYTVAGGVVAAPRTTLAAFCGGGGADRAGSYTRASS
jgi:hypothetical protein